MEVRREATVERESDLTLDCAEPREVERSPMLRETLLDVSLRRRLCPANEGGSMLSRDVWMGIRCLQKHSTVKRREHRS